MKAENLIDVGGGVGREAEAQCGIVAEEKLLGERAQAVELEGSRG